MRFSDGSLLFLFSAVLVFVSFLWPLAVAQNDDLILRLEQRWDTYGVGGTCIPGTHDLIIADVDDDGTNEIITGGFSYLTNYSTRTNLEAPLRIMSWNGQELIFEKKENWAGNIWVVYAADADRDGRTEILTLGTVSENNQSLPALRFWNWNGNSLVLRATFFNVSASSIFVSDFDNDGKTEIATVGRPLNTSSASAQLSIWSWNGTTLELLSSETWRNGNSSQANSVYAFDLNQDGIREIVTAGYDNGMKNSSGQLRVWQWGGGSLSLKSNMEWRSVENTYALDVAGNPMGNTIVNNVKIAEIDNDGVPEIMTGGFTFDGTQVKGQLRIWNWTNNELRMEKSQEWATYEITELKSLTINDVDKDGKPEIVTSGVTAGRGAFAENATIKELAQLRVWKWDGTNLTLNRGEDWIVDDGVCAWQDGTADLDNDGKVEIVTVGCSYLQTLCDPNLRIWSYPNKSMIAKSPTILVIAAATTIAVAIVGVAIMAQRQKKKH